MPGIVLAWLIGEGIIIYRSYKDNHRPPMPGQLLASTALFTALGLVARSDQGKFLANAMAWGFDIAAFLNLSQAYPLTGDLQKIAEATPSAGKGSAGKAKSAFPGGG